MKYIQKHQNGEAGFTLIELVVVIVILGILAAVAIPKFVDLSDEASVAALQGVVGGINSASAINYAAKSANSAKGQTTTGLTCKAAVTAIMQGGIPNGYTLDDATLLVAGENTCVVTPAKGATASATVIGV